MSSIFKFIGWATIILAFIAGVFYGNSEFSKLFSSGFAWSLAIGIWVSGIIFGIIFFALALILDYVEYIQALLLAQQPIHSNSKATYPEHGISNTKTTLAKAADYTMKHMD